MREGKPGYTMDQHRVYHPKHPTMDLSMRRSVDGKWQYILCFFWLLYVSEAEILPTRFGMPSEKVLKANAHDEDFEERYVTNYLRDIDAQFAMPSIEHLGPGSFLGPCRFLEWAQPVDIFYQYVAHEENEGRKPSTLTTFMKVYHKVFGTFLKFRGKLEHAQCNHCARLKAKIKGARSKSDRTQFVREFSQHILSQWLDRQVYWKIRGLSQRFFSASLPASDDVGIFSSVACIIVDGMDQSKLRTPRFGHLRISKLLEQVFRPTLHLAGVWIHGSELYLPISDESLKKDSETQIEMMARSLSALCRLGPGRLPLGCHIQADNCFREGKNQYIACFLLLLTVIGAFRFTSMGFLRTAHSHEDIDQIFGQVSRLLKAKSFNTPSQLIQLLQSVTQRSGEPSRIRGTVVHPYKLDEVARWKQFTQQLGIAFKGLRCLTLRQI